MYFFFCIVRAHLLHFQVLRDQYGVRCFLGLTATATKSTAADVVKHLGIDDINAATIRGSPVPPNLRLSVSRDENRDEVGRR
jgi:ATP-dependent DNA helicase Q4